MKDLLLEKKARMLGTRVERNTNSKELSFSQMKKGGKKKLCKVTKVISGS